MAALHITKVAVGCGDADALRDRLTGRATAGETFITTRYRPNRHAELVGGSLFWIIKHQLVARSPILRFEEDERGHCLIRLEHALLPVRARPKRAHQGWRYLTAEDAPLDLDGEADELATLPPGLMSALAALALV
ncbi:DUF1489 domain-containing protein [uncultured Sphingomonas sp.]|uniref:DUF1489 domain-containing protein n=1 Tax=uncultured Sphingomonas sp. TaxID=158754 RepID=UPI0025FCB8D0|nr:DUF1489 domain-containing protein [uncultured Sphingomonas sp.]